MITCEGGKMRGLKCLMVVKTPLPHLPWLSKKSTNSKAKRNHVIDILTKLVIKQMFSCHNKEKRENMQKLKETDEKCLLCMTDRQTDKTLDAHMS